MYTNEQKWVLSILIFAFHSNSKWTVQIKFKLILNSTQQYDNTIVWKGQYISLIIDPRVDVSSIVYITIQQGIYYLWSIYFNWVGHRPKSYIK